MNLFNGYNFNPARQFCFGGPKPPTAAPAPTIGPPPTILPTSTSEVSSQETARKQRIAQLRYGFTSTIKNQGGAKGILNNGNPELQPNGNTQGSRTLG